MRRGGTPQRIGGMPLRVTSSLAVVGAVAVLAGCGGSSKPGYCTDRSDLESSIKGLGDVDLAGGGLNALQQQLEKVQSDAKSLVSSAKSDFPSQTSALETSISSLSDAIKQLGSSPSATQVAGLIPDVQSVTSAVKGFADATSSKC
jgi:hypothetical protein